ncbi:pyridoxamine 5'-phosphate oxidase family protein [Xanthomonas massiliensis]|uniref:pyridoxamine 5'-phosphate oxidase family protein n=1 Tax=Xanthomonas massiliensis TaxID=1720302 RepID=UPI0008252F63|nr:pyridoxamine 5'-phosphate oxidase family protein [Xanthomonas massiliensis]
MNPLPARIEAFLQDHHVLSLAVCRDGEVWAANAFFAFDPAGVRFVFLGSQDTRHAAMLQANPHAAGTIAGQPLEISEIRGLQFEGDARLLETPVQRDAALGLYRARFPQAAALSAPAWELRPLRMKLTDNRLGFGTKILWTRDAG